MTSRAPVSTLLAWIALGLLFGAVEALADRPCTSAPAALFLAGPHR